MNLRKKLAWIFLLYLAQGFPFGFIKDVLPYYFREHGVSLTGIGLISLLGLPWSLKFIWSPLVDLFGERKSWITSCLIIMALLMLLIPFFDPSSILVRLWVVLLAFTIASATQDIGIDAYTIGLVDRGEEGMANGVRVTAYRIAIIIGGGGILMLADWIDWKYLFVVAAALLGILALGVWQTPPLIVDKKKRHQLLISMRNWLNQPGALAVFLFILTYKLGDAALGPMVKPFWVDRGLSNFDIGLVSISLGVIATILGALLGGYLISRWGIFHGLWILGLAAAFTNLGYTAVAWINPAAPTLSLASFSFSTFLAALREPVRPLIYSASLIESFTQGLGTAAFLSLLMRICQKEYAATQYALLSAFFALTRDAVGAISGFATESLGYASYFTLTFFLAFPAYVFLPWIRPWIKEKAGDDSESSKTPNN